MTGKRLGRYELLEQLGEGGMGAVWLARLGGAAGFEKLCIVKTVLPSIAKDADFVSRFLHEGRVLTQLTHGNIAQVLDMNEAEGQLFLALEYVAGVDLARLHEQVRAGQEYMPTALVVALIGQAAEGLGAAHRKTALDGTPLHVVHRDVSPQNIMVSYEGEVKVIDFGIAKSEARSRHTAQASVMGKLGYMAPEQARGENVDHRADQYALAIVLWELLSNQPFVRRGTLTEMVAAMALPTVRPLAPLRPDVPASLEAVVLKALAPLPDARFADTDAFAQALTAELLALGPPPTKQQLGEYVKTRCAQEFSSQRQLLSRISTLKGLPTQPPVPADPFAATAVRLVEQPTTMPHPNLASTAPLSATPAATVPGRPAVLATPLSTLPAPAEPPRPAPLGNAAVAPAAPSSGEGTAPLGSPAVAPAADFDARGLTTGELAAAVKPRRTGLLIGLGLAVVVALAIAVAFTFVKEQQPPLVVDAGTALPTLIDAGPPEVVDAGAALAEPTDAATEFVEGAPRPAPQPDGTVVGPPPVEPEPQPAQPALQVMGRQPVGGGWILTNLAGQPWSKCRLTVPGQRVARIGSVPPNGSVEIAASLFRKDPAAVALQKELRVDCAEGVGTWRLR